MGVGPHDGAHRPALRCAVSVGVPLLVVLVLGRDDLLGAVTFGAFTAIYGRDVTVPARTRVQGAAAVALVVGAAAGLLAAHLPGAPWSVLGVLVVIAVAATALGEVVRWRPSGPLFPLMTAGALSASPPLAWSAALGVLVAVGVTAVFAIAVGSAGVVRRDHPWAPLTPLTPVAAALRARLVGQVLLACVVAAPFAELVDVEHLYWALLSAVIPLSVATLRKQVVRGVHRVAGTTAGLGLAALLLWAHLPVWAVALAVVVLQGLIELLVLRHYAVAVVLITPMSLLVGAAAHPTPVGPLLVDRLVATAVGVAVAVVVLAVPPLLGGLRARTRPSAGRGPARTPR
ncbi:hypothetical protein BJP25_18585 [Actinokineospora bangkokensis]|uniref:Integral membrane bound transporter domain-containing protein n=1 Tax=Actinokineospora bangkokensis TaxID=1193682 RepID=A0A1Q9LLV2_9PSEU|nr:hypothetical protein BJP25_18585 [Actinokineospora bangkokensis]